MKAEKKFMLQLNQFSYLYQVYGLEDDFSEAFSRDELSFWGVPQEVFEATRKGPVTIKLTIEAL